MPEYFPSQHEIYVDYLLEALSDRAIRNIALSGEYGSGKSSILMGLRQRLNLADKKVVQVSLGGIAGATIEGSADPEPHLQREILRQILYTAQPSTLRRLRFGAAPLLGVQHSKIRASVHGLIAVALLAAPVTLRLFGFLADSALYLTLQFLAVASAIFILFWSLSKSSAIAARFVANLKFRLPGATLELSNTEVPLLEEYSDDLIRFFRAEKVRVVIFEDLDRYQNPRIFDSLKNLNEALNRAMNTRGDPTVTIRFIYAIRDLVFFQSGSASIPNATDVDPAFRTKYFDLIIPVVPYVSPNNSSALFKQYLSLANIDVDAPDLIYLIGQNCSEVRTLKNICNEYRIYHDVITRSTHSVNGTFLLAAVAYKNAMPGDLELISTGKSRLDALDKFRALVVGKLLPEADQKRLSILASDPTGEGRSPLAERASKILETILETRFDLTQADIETLIFHVGGEQFARGQLASIDVWGLVVRHGHIGVKSRQSQLSEFRISAEIFKLADPDLFDANAWALDASTRRGGATWVANNDFHGVAHADFSELYTNEKARLSMTELEGSQIYDLIQADRTLSERSKQDGYVSFHDFFNALMPEPLARELITSGYITGPIIQDTLLLEDSTLCDELRQFEISHIVSNSSSLYRAFSSSDVARRAFREFGDRLLTSRAVWNIQLFNLMLSGDEGLHLQSSRAIEYLISDPGPEQDEFLIAYISDGNQKQELIRELIAAEWPHIFEFLLGGRLNQDTYLLGSLGRKISPIVRTGQISTTELIPLIAGALQTTLFSTSIRFPKELWQFIDEHFASIIECWGEAVEDGLPEVEKILACSPIQLKGISKLSSAALDLILRTSIWQINETNLECIGEHYRGQGGPTSASLDKLSQNEIVFNYCIFHFNEYHSAYSELNRNEICIFETATVEKISAAMRSLPDGNERTHAILKFAAPSAGVKRN